MTNLRTTARRFQPHGAARDRHAVRSATTPDDPADSSFDALARRLWRAHGLPAPLRDVLPWTQGAPVVARVLTACERDPAFAAFDVPKQRAVRLAVRRLAEADGIVWPVRVSNRSARDRGLAASAAVSIEAVPVGGGVA